MTGWGVPETSDTTLIDARAARARGRFAAPCYAGGPTPPAYTHFTGHGDMDQGGTVERTRVSRGITRVARSGSAKASAARQAAGVASE